MCIQPTLLHIVPTLAQLFLHHPALNTAGFDKLHTIFCAAAPLGAQTAGKLLEKFDQRNITIQEGKEFIQR